MQTIYSFSHTFKLSLFKEHERILEQISVNSEGDISDSKYHFCVKSEPAFLLDSGMREGSQNFP